MTMTEDKKALDYLRNFIEHLLNVSVSTNIEYKDFSYILYIHIGDNMQTLKFSKSLVEDFDVAIEKYKDTNYFYGLESSVKFTFYSFFGVNNLLPAEFKISDEIVSERREWITNYRVNTQFDESSTEIFLAGLKLLSTFFGSLIEKYKDLDMQSITNYKLKVDHLIIYYNKHGNLNSAGAEFESLSYLKASAVTFIIDLEKKRNEANLDIIKSEINKKIFEVVDLLRMSPFLDIKLPEFMKDVAKGLR